MQNTPEHDNDNVETRSRADNPPARDSHGDQVAPPKSATQATPRPARGARSDEVTPEGRAAAYWRANVRLLLWLLAIWFTVSYGFGILLVDWLNRVSLFGFKLGFWWAQQGSIYVFVALIFVYVALAHRLDRKFGVADDTNDRQEARR